VPVKFKNTHQKIHHLFSLSLFDLARGQPRGPTGKMSKKPVNITVECAMIVAWEKRPSASQLLSELRELAKKI
jgi:hypothetical protein